jgi:hypothetical protein
MFISPPLLHERDQGVSHLPLLWRRSTIAAEGMGNSNRRSWRNADQHRATKIESIKHRFKIAPEASEGDVGRIVIRETDSADVKPNEPKPIGEKVQERSPDRMLPFVLDMVEPRGMKNERCAMTN